MHNEYDNDEPKFTLSQQQKYTINKTKKNINGVFSLTFFFLHLPPQLNMPQNWHNTDKD